MKQRWDKVVSMLFQSCFNVRHRRCIFFVQHWNTDVEFYFFSALDQRYFNVDPKSWNNVDSTLKCWLGLIFLTCNVRLTTWIKTQQTFVCLKSTTETVEKGVKYVKRNTKNTRTKSMTLFSCLYCCFWTYCTSFCSISILEF